MTVSIDGTQIGEIIEVASLVGSIVTMLVVGLLVYLMVRPPRHVRERRKAEKRGEIRSEIRSEMDPVETEELWRVVDRMESRLEVLERALADQVERPALGGRERELDLVPVEDGRETGGKK